MRRNSSRAPTARGVGVDPIISVPEMSMSNARMTGLAFTAIMKVRKLLYASDDDKVRWRLALSIDHFNHVQLDRPLLIHLVEIYMSRLHSNINAAPFDQGLIVYSQ